MRSSRWFALLALCAALAISSVASTDDALLESKLLEEIPQEEEAFDYEDSGYDQEGEEEAIPGTIYQPPYRPPPPIAYPGEQANVSEPVYGPQPVPPPVPHYQQPVYQPPPFYPAPQPPPQPAYPQQPSYAPPVVKEVITPVYKEVITPVYKEVITPVLKEVITPVLKEVVTPVVKEVVVPVYKEVVVTSYKEQPNYQPQYQAPTLNYSVVRPYQPVAKPYQVQTNYSLPVALNLNRYSGADLASLVPLAGYRANHWSLHYYKAAPYRTCPKQNYLSQPSPKDIELAFAYAQRQLQLARDSSVTFFEAGQQSAAARHQVFSLLAQANARLDEEGLLLEFVSQYLADRACLTKWDKQRYLPSLTKFISVSQFPYQHSCSQLYRNPWQASSKSYWASKYRTFDGFANNPYHPYWGKSNVCHIRALSPDYADGISHPRNSYNQRFPLPNPRVVSNFIHNDVPLEGPYNHMKMQWGQFINHDITNTALSSYDGLVDCCKNPNTRGCWPINVQGDRFYQTFNITCLNFLRSGVCPTCQLGPREQLNKNTAFLDLSHVYGQNIEQANSLREFKGGLLKFSLDKNGEMLLPVAGGEKGQEQCSGVCFVGGDSRVNQHPGLTAMQVMMLRSHQQHARNLALRHPTWSDEMLFQEARRISIAEYQMITYNEYLPIVFGPILSAYYKLSPLKSGYTWWDPKTDPTTWNEYASATCRFGHSQIQSTFGLYSKLLAYGQPSVGQPSYRLREWFMRPSILSDGMYPQIVTGLLSQSSYAVDPWLTTDVRNYLYQSRREPTGGDLAATNIWRGRDHGIPGYVHYVEYCFNIRVRNWKDLSIFIPYYTLNQLRKLYKVVENIDLFTGGLSERHFPGADIGPTFACINGIQYHHLKFGDRYFFEHGGQAGSFQPDQLQEIRRSTLARLICRTSSFVRHVPQYAFLQASQYNPIVNCTQIGGFDYSKF